MQRLITNNTRIRAALLGGLIALGCHNKSKSIDPSTGPQASADKTKSEPANQSYASSLSEATADRPFLPPKDAKSHRNGAPSPGKNPIDLARLKLPDGFSIEIYSKEVPNARTLRRGGPGIVYVGNRQEDKVYALVDKDGDHRPEAVHVIASGLDQPNGLAYRDGDLFIAEVSKITRLNNIDNQLENPPKPVLVTDTLPNKKHHGWRYIDFGPDGLLYIAIGAPCNICKREEPIFASISRLDPLQEMGGKMDVFARGVRNSLGFGWHPTTGEFWFTENGGDDLGDDLPGDELNRVTSEGQDFGYPACHAGIIADPKFGSPQACAGTQQPVQVLDPHVAALGMEFTAGRGLPAPHEQSVLIAEHGSWNREKKLGYRVMEVRLEGNRATHYLPFIDGWVDATSDTVWGRPVDLEFLDDGSILLSDDWQGAVYRVVPPSAKKAPALGNSAPKSPPPTPR